MRNNNSLYVLAEEYAEKGLQLYNATDEDGVVDVAIMNEMLAAKGSFEEKAIAVATVIRMFDDDISQTKSEIERLKNRLQRLEKKQTNIKRYLSDACEKADTYAIDGLYANISFRASEETIIDDESQIPYDFITEKITYAPDKAKIKAAIKAGQVVSGAHIESKRNIQIR